MAGPSLSHFIPPPCRVLLAEGGGRSSAPPDARVWGFPLRLTSNPATAGGICGSSSRRRRLSRSSLHSPPAMALALLSTYVRRTGARVRLSPVPKAGAPRLAAPAGCFGSVEDPRAPRGPPGDEAGTLDAERRQSCQGAPRLASLGSQAGGGVGGGGAGGWRDGGGPTAIIIGLECSGGAPRLARARPPVVQAETPGYAPTTGRDPRVRPNHEERRVGISTD